MSGIKGRKGSSSITTNQRAGRGTGPKKGSETMKEQTLFSQEELSKVETQEERDHLIKCANDESKIDLKYFEIMKKYDLFL